jgi:hypothetical protein
MTTYKGIVQDISTKEVKTKFGPKTTYSFKLDNQWFRLGFSKPKFSKGDQVSFESLTTDYGEEVDSKNVLVSATATATDYIPTTSSRGTASMSNKGVFPIPPLDGQRSIVRQNALTNARETYTLCKAAIVYNEEKVATDIISLARRFEAYTAGDLDMNEAKQEIQKGKLEKEVDAKT